MVEIFLVQFLAAALGAASTALADWLYHTARIRQRLHSFWVSASIAVISLPVVAWVCNVFLGSGLLGRSVAAALVGAVFLWVYQNLRKLPAAAESENAPVPGAPLERCSSPRIRD
jgi:hypothetical protein